VKEVLSPKKYASTVAPAAVVNRLKINPAATRILVICFMMICIFIEGKIEPDSKKNKCPYSGNPFPDNGDVVLSRRNFNQRRMWPELDRQV
jgi:hypothetical protein